MNMQSCTLYYAAIVAVVLIAVSHVSPSNINQQTCKSCNMQCSDKYYCQQACTGRHCNMKCDSSQICTQNCTNGYCDVMSCDGDTICNSDCDGGNCKDMRCTSKNQCQMTCDKNCAMKFNAPSSTAMCHSGNCQITFQDGNRGSYGTVYCPGGNCHVKCAGPKYCGVFLCLPNNCKITYEKQSRKASQKGISSAQRSHSSIHHHIILACFIFLSIFLAILI